MDDKIKLTTVEGEEFNIPEDGSLGLLALGYVGLVLWREKRKKQKKKPESKQKVQ